MRQSSSYIIETVRDGRKTRQQKADCTNSILAAVKDMLDNDVIEVNIRVSNERMKIDSMTQVDDDMYAITDEDRKTNFGRF